MDKLKTIIKSSPFVIAFVYMIVGAIWIQYSDQIVLSMIEDPETLTRVQSYKGWFYVFVSGILIFFLVYQSNDIIQKLVDDVKRSSKKFESTFDNAPIGIAHHKPNENWILVNMAMCDLLGYSKQELLKLDFREFIHPDDLERGRNLDRDLVRGKKTSYKTEKKYIRKDGSVFTGRVTKAVVFDKNQKPLYLIAILEDITKQKEHETKLKESVHQKEQLLAEVHHRVKNNIALMYALLELQLLHGKNTDTEFILEQYKSRLKSLSLVYENFSDPESEPLIKFNSFLNDQISYLKERLYHISDDIQYKVDIEEIDLNVNQAIPVGLICNELLINTANHTFDIVEQPFIRVTFKENEDIVEFEVQNNGKTSGKLIDLNDPDSLDSRIIGALCKQVDGNVSVTDSNNLHSYKLAFKKGTWRGAASNINPN